MPPKKERTESFSKFIDALDVLNDIDNLTKAESRAWDTDLSENINLKEGLSWEEGYSRDNTLTLFEDATYDETLSGRNEKGRMIKGTSYPTLGPDTDYWNKRTHNTDPVNITHLIKLANIWNESKQPYINLEAGKHTTGAYASYSPIKHGINVHKANLIESSDTPYSKKRKKDNLINSFIAEAGHSLSFTNKDKSFWKRQWKNMPYYTGEIVDIITGLLPVSEKYKTHLQHGAYDKLGTEEYYAHKVVQPLLEEYMTSTNEKSLYELLQTVE
jgi:hypothetical protein